MSSFQYLKQLVKKRDLMVVLDDFFPNLLSAFRVAEYNWYLERFPKLIVYSANPDFDAVHAEYAQRYPQFADRVRPYTETSLDGCAFAYLNFLNNASRFLNALNLYRVPFFMTLYPGGGFGLEELESDIKLERVLRSPLLRGIITTQSVTLDYLKAKSCTVPLYDIYGGVINPIYFEDEAKNKHNLLDSNSIVRICFVAERYMPHGENKGYPQFIELAQQLISELPNLRFSVVGSFDAETVPLGEKLSACISFNGLLTTDKLKEFYLTQNIIISPNSPYMLHPGNFDGFPTGCCVEASLCGVAVVCSDELNLNCYYTDGADIVICEPVAEALVKSVKRLIREPDLLMSIGEHGKIISQEIFDPERQLGQREALLIKALEHNNAQWPIKLVEHFKISEQIIVDQADHISCMDAEMSAHRQRIIELEHIIQNVVADWAARGKVIEKFQNSIYGKSISRLSQLFTAIKSKRT